MKAEEIIKMDVATRKEKMNELKLELAKNSVSAQKAKRRTKEIKKAIARLFTVANAEKSRALHAK